MKEEAIKRIVDNIAFEDGSRDPYGWMLDAVAVDNLPCNVLDAAVFVDGWISAAADRSGLHLTPDSVREVAAGLHGDRRDYYRLVCRGVLAVADRWRAAMALCPVPSH